MSQIKMIDRISGSISGEPTLSGSLSIATSQEHEVYSGSYEVTPSINDDQILDTAHKVLSDDIVVNKVPYFETSNNSNGKTVYIGKDV